MKINVLRHLVIPWIILFLIISSGIIFVGVYFHIPAREHRMFQGLLGMGAIFCIYLNLVTLSKAGIWIAYSLPSYLSRNPWSWIVRALIAAVVAYAVYGLGQVSWVPLAWQAFVIPAVFAIALFVGVWSLMGPILIWSSRVSFCRAVAWILSLPVFALVPVTAVFVGQLFVEAYTASRSEMIVIKLKPQPVLAEPLEATSDPEPTTPSASSDHRVVTLKEAVESGKPCFEQSKLIQQALEPKNSEAHAYWGVKAVKCSDLKSVVALPKLIRLVQDHPSTKVKAIAIQALPKYGTEELKKISYFLVKRINEKEPPEVIEAATHILLKLGEDEFKIVSKKLTGLLESPKASPVAAHLLIQSLKRENAVFDYVAANLMLQGEARDRAVGLICLLSPSQHTFSTPQLEQVVAALKTGDDSDPAKKALDCLGTQGLQAIQKEVTQPQQLEVPLAARTMAEMTKIRQDPSVLSTAEVCVRDKNSQVRKWCGQSLGKIGHAALPAILDLLKSNDSDLKESGQQALSFFDDVEAKSELEKIRADNSGWMANQKKLQIARAIDTALIKMQDESIEDVSKSK